MSVYSLRAEHRETYRALSRVGLEPMLPMTRSSPSRIVRGWGGEPGM